MRRALRRMAQVMLFMKGNKMFPQCGFSNTAVMILKSITEDFETFDVLADNEIREGIKAYSNWPTIPQARAVCPRRASPSRASTNPEAVRSPLLQCCCVRGCVGACVCDCACSATSMVSSSAAVTC